MRLAALTATLVLPLTLTACGGGSEEDAEIEETEREPAFEAVPGDAADTRPEAENGNDAAASPGAGAARDDLDDTRAAAAENAPDARAVLAGFGAPYTEADLSNGGRLWRRCQSCHTLEAGAPHRVGPNLHGLFDREVGTAEGFGYSSALEEADFEWSADQLDQWLADPRGFLPGNRMSFAGLRSEQDRADLIAWLAVETAE